MLSESGNGITKLSSIAGYSTDCFSSDPSKFRFKRLYKKKDEGSGFGKVNSTMVPMIRMSEVYYIAAEAIYDTDKELAKTYLKTVKQG